MKHNSTSREWNIFGFPLPRRPWLWWLALLAMALLVAGVNNLRQRYLQPPRYSSRAVLAINARDEELLQRTIEDQIEFLYSLEILEPVVEQLKLANREEAADPPARIRAIERLRASMQVHRVKNSPLLEVEVRDEDSASAARMANAIVSTYRSRRTEIESSLDPEFALQQGEVTRLRTLVKAEELELPGLTGAAQASAQAKWQHDQQLLETAEVTYKRAESRRTEFEPVRIYQKAEPAPKPMSWWSSW